MINLLLYLFIAIFISFLCSILEAVILSITPSFIEAKIKQRRKYAEKLRKMKSEIDTPLAAILTLNTFAHTIGAAGVGAQAQIIWGNEYLSIVSIVLTILILFLSEIIPKTLGATYWKQLANPASHILKIMIIILYPFVIISRFITRLLNKGKNKSVLSREEIGAMAEIGRYEGLLKEGESTIILNLLKFENILVKDIMTPRTMVVSANEEMLIKDFFEENKNLVFSRIPVYKKTIDSVSGFVLKNDILMSVVNNNGGRKLKEIRRHIMAVYDRLPIPELFNFLLKKNEHIALVIDEYGGMQGVVSIEDIIETLLGLEIMDETDTTEDLQIRARKNWEERAEKLGLISKIKDKDH